jgi:hypothetical protein
MRFFEILLYVVSTSEVTECELSENADSPINPGKIHSMTSTSICQAHVNVLTVFKLDDQDFSITSVKHGNTRNVNKCVEISIFWLKQPRTRWVFRKGGGHIAHQNETPFTSSFSRGNKGVGVYLRSACWQERDVTRQEGVR